MSTFLLSYFPTFLVKDACNKKINRIFAAET